MTTAELQAGAPSIQSEAFTILSNQPWQSTGVTIPPFVEVMIVYQNGLWTADPDTNGGKPYDAAGCPGLLVPTNQTNYPITGVQMGALVGRLDGGAPFLIGNGPYTIISAAGGALDLCINDDLTGQYGAGLEDNRGNVNVFIYPTNTPPDTGTPLAHDPAQISPAVPAGQLGGLSQLIGTWTNQNLGGSNQGGPQAPFSYNVMPLPQVDPSSPTGYILKNFTYYEELTFTAIHGNAPNRGGIGQQVAYALFYEQRVYFAEGPNKDALIHAENGSLLLLLDSTQPLGPYGNGDSYGLGNQVVKNSVAPTQQYNLVKQVSVPHGNSILALGAYSQANAGPGVPLIPSVSPLPQGIPTVQYTVDDPVTNPQPGLTANPNQVLVNALLLRPCTNFLHLSMSTANGTGAVTNIGYEQQHANVSRYDFNYWLESFDGSGNYTQLQYSQTITLQIPINGKTVSFPHVTANTLTKVKGS
jgi:hypothetical protein